MKELLDTVGLFGEFIQIDNEVGESLEDNEGVNDIYFFIGKENHIKDKSTEKLLDVVKKGNTAFIAAEIMPEMLNDEFFLNTKSMYDVERDSIQKFKFVHKKLNKKTYTFEYIYNNNRQLKSWKYFKDNNFDLWDENEAFILGRDANGKPNFIKITYGDGVIFFHSNPYVFTNVCMLRKSGFEYAENMLKHIPPGVVQWDKYNLRRHWNSNSKGDGDNDGGNEERRSILEFIFKNQALTWAFVILIIAAFLYAVFKGKRQQDIVRPAESKENTSCFFTRCKKRDSLLIKMEF